MSYFSVGYFELSENIPVLTVAHRDWSIRPPVLHVQLSCSVKVPPVPLSSPPLMGRPKKVWTVRYVPRRSRVSSAS